MDAQTSGINTFPHQPVLYHESLKYLQLESGNHFIDGTLGAGGHAFGILTNTSPHTELLAFDLDKQALAIARDRLKKLTERIIFKHQSYASMKEVVNQLGWGCADGIILDLGISSMQVDHPERGFSFLHEAPLDMRFNQSRGQTAADLLNSMDENEIADIIWKFGDEPRSRRIAKFIVDDRPVETTSQLAGIVQKAYRGYRTKAHPATKTFQAVRIAVNSELEVLKQGLKSALATLCTGGRLAVITFHSLEDRIVKRLFKTEAKDCICPAEQMICTCDHKASIMIITKKPVIPSKEEVERNPRARSAKLRVAEKI